MGIKGNKYHKNRIVVIVGLLLSLFSLPLVAQYNENVIKAAYIERITRFVEWPVKENLSIDQFVIGVYKDDDFYNALTEVFKDKRIKDHKVRVITVVSPEQITECNLCYLSPKAKSLIGTFISSSNLFGVLLVSGTNGFGKSGVHINFYIEDEKLKFEINEKSLGTTGFRVSYLLMQNNRIIQ
jgi:hypothetical protein